MTSKLFKTNGEIIDVIPENTYFSLKELQNFVKGRIEILSDENISIVCNEDGISKNLLYNENACKYCEEISFYVNFLLGDILICDSKFLEQ